MGTLMRVSHTVETNTHKDESQKERKKQKFLAIHKRNFIHQVPEPPKDKHRAKNKECLPENMFPL